MTPLLPDSALQFFGPAVVGNYGGVPWDDCVLVNPDVQPLEQVPMGGKIALFNRPMRFAAIVSGTVDDDTDGPGGSTGVDPCYQRETSLTWPDGSSINSREFRGMVMHKAIEDCGGGLGDLGMSCCNGVLHCVQYADLGPIHKFQEGFEKILRDEGVIRPSESSRHAAVDGNDVNDFCSLIFLGSAPKDKHGRPYALPLSEIIDRTLTLWRGFTGRAAPATS